MRNSTIPTDSDFIKQLSAGALDQILLYLAFNSMRVGGHRHGVFLAAAETAAKCAVYATYTEHKQNIRVTGYLHHIEPKRIKAIVEEVQQMMFEGKVLKMFASHFPSYFIQFPYTWLEKYPWNPGQPRIQDSNLSEAEICQIEKKLAPHFPPAQILTSLQVMELIYLLHQRSQAHLPESQQTPMSEALAEHIKSRLTHANTVMRVCFKSGVSFYALAQTFYSPVDEAERTQAMLEDVARYFCLLQRWANHSPHTLRILEELDLLVEETDLALADLDDVIRSWADRHHQTDGVPFALQMAIARNS